MKQPYTPRTLPEARELVALAENDETFKVRRRDGLTAINYVHITGDPDQFEHPFSDFRGLIVDEATNTVTARPFQKFWNAGEKAAEPTDWDEPHAILPKLDGSLVYPAMGRLVTKGGVTDTSLRAEALAEAIGEPFRALVEHLQTDPADGARCTPLFEYIGRDNKIVIHYRVSQMVLLAVRRIGDGRYRGHEDIARAFKEVQQDVGTDEHLAMVHPVTGIQSGKDGGNPQYARGLIETVAAWGGDREGVVVAFEHSGHRLKIKSREYVALHRARDDYSLETRVLRCWADGNTDQLLANLAEDRARRLKAYYEEITERVDRTARETADTASRIFATAGRDRKTAALAWIAATADRQQTRRFGFTAFDALARNEDPGRAVAQEIRKAIDRKCRRQTSIDREIRPLLGDRAPIWAPSDGNQEDADA